MELPGFDHLLATCRRLGIDVRLHPPAVETPDVAAALGRPFDPQLAALLGRTNGGLLKGWFWEHWLFGYGEPNDLCGFNVALRDGVPALGDLVMFAQAGASARHPATVPALAAADGAQPVVEVDLNEDVVVVPIASSVDRAFEARARHLELAGSDDASADLLFPWDVPEILAADRPLVAAIERGDFRPYATTDPATIALLERVRAAAS